jgi:ABC-type glycerol-3-phosphate transport system permease component
MSNYWAYWRRGWWVWLMMLCMNIGFALVVLPLAFLFKENTSAYLGSVLIAWLAIGAPFFGWLFERFATGSPRIGAGQTGPSYESVEAD